MSGRFRWLWRRAQPNVTFDDTEARWDKVTEIVNGVLQRPDPRDRQRFLRQACGRDVDLRREVDRLLGYEELAEDQLPHLVQRAGPSAPEVGLGPHAEVESDATTEPLPKFEEGMGPGRMVGAYRIERWLGGGGMGRVALALDSVLDRHVALKLIRRDKVSPELRRRFHRERRILARLEHPNIAKIFDSGTHNGMPFFVMERVRGEAIDQWCDRRHLSVEGRLRLVIKVCRALSEAHSNLVVHRDLKPSNILVTKEGEPKVLDFGIAKELPESGDDGSPGPTTRNQPMTLPYAAPEQVRNRPASVATDIYGLGVLLYGLLCGHPPYALDGDLFENVRQICEEPPPPPSTRAALNLEIWRNGSPHNVPPVEIAACRGADPPRLRKLLRGDLDAVVLKALAKDPRHRYRSMDQLAEDLLLHLENRPVSALQGSWGYRARKFARRHHRLFAAGLLALWGSAGAVAWLDSESRARTAGLEALEAEREAEAATAFARNLVFAADPDLTGSRLTVEDMLRRAEDEARKVLAERPKSLAHQLEALALVMRSRVKYEASRHLLVEALDLRRDAYQGDHRLIARSLNNLAALDHKSGNLQAAEEGYRMALAMKARLKQPQEDLARVQTNLASLLLFRGDYDEAEDLLLDLLERLRSAPKINLTEISSVLRSLGTLYFLSRRFDEAEPLLLEALDLRIELHGKESLHTASVMSSLGRLYHAQGRFEAAEDALTETLKVRRPQGDDHLHVAITRKDLSALYYDMGESEIADILWRRAFEVLNARQPSGWEMADLWRIRGHSLEARNLAEGAVCLEEAYQILSRIRGSTSYYAKIAQKRSTEHKGLPQ